MWCLWCRTIRSFINVLQLGLALLWVFVFFFKVVGFGLLAWSTDQPVNVSRCSGSANRKRSLVSKLRILLLLSVCSEENLTSFLSMWIAPGSSGNATQMKRDVQRICRSYLCWSKVKFLTFLPGSDFLSSWFRLILIRVTDNRQISCKSVHQG